MRIGETVRRIVGKLHCSRHASSIRARLMAERQLGVAVPGACEGLVHVHRAAEELIRTGDCGAWPVVDLDLVN